MASQQPDRPRGKKDDKEPGMLKAWFLRVFVYAPALWSLMIITHAFVQFPEDRADVFCTDSYRFMSFYYVSMLMPLSFSDPEWTFERANYALNYKQECDQTAVFGMVGLIPNIYRINTEE